eukprot:4223227-Prorocentrum_lima.AAC.1
MVGPNIRQLSFHPKEREPSGERRRERKDFPNHEDGKEKRMIPTAALKSATNAQRARKDLPDNPKTCKAKPS